MKLKLCLAAIFWIILLSCPAGAADLAFMVLDQNSYVARKALDTLYSQDNITPHRLQNIDIQLITVNDLMRDPAGMKKLIEDTGLIVVDVMGRELKDFLTDGISLSGKILYALRGSLDDDGLKKMGFIFDNEVATYYQHISQVNISNMLRLVIHRHLNSKVTYENVRPRPKLGLYHPDIAPDTPGTDGGVFTRVEDYLDWQAGRPGYDARRPSIGFIFFSSFLIQGQRRPMDDTIQRLETEGFNVIPCFGREKQILEKYYVDDIGQSRVDMILTFSFKFNNALTPELNDLMKQLDVPVFSAISGYKHTIEEWRESPMGIDALEVAWSVAVPEISGLIEPTMLAAKEKIVDKKTGKTFFVGRLVPENMDRLIPRLKKWAVLQKMANPDKKVAIMFYNHHQGKQNIGASYLNVFRSLESIMAALSKEGYDTGRDLIGKAPGKNNLSEMEIKNLILTSARNVGSWAPGELEKMAAGGKLMRLPISTYKKWFNVLPEDFKANVIRQWGQPETSKIMVLGDDFIIPMVETGKFIFLPEPSRGWGDDADKLYHDTTVYPHHQYLAVYLWLQKGFKADAMIHLGTHATYEWTPGKQAGLSPSCAPEVLITDIPNLYPYIVDDVGEGIQAKRRGRGVIISHLTPVLKKADISKEYARMAELAGEIERAEARGSVTVKEKEKELFDLAKETGVMEDLKADTADLSSEETVQLLAHYLEEIKSSMIPYGMHTFGRSPKPEALAEMSEAIKKWNPPDKAEGRSARQIDEAILKCGPDEMGSLIKGLEGRYVHPAQGNDPVRNPAAIPTGKNFYGFNPGKMPSPAAWELGKKAAQQIIDNHIAQKGKYPQKVGVVLWATEALRNEGVNECTIMYLMGTRPKWSKTGRILGIDVIKGKALNRPRIDVMINASGLYRDLFPDKMMYLDKAVQLAAKQTDVENLISRHNAEIKTRLIREGMDTETADEISRFRIYSEPAGAYGNGVSEMAGGSSKWENESQVVDVYENRMGYAFGEGKSGRRWGMSARPAFKAQLSQVDVAVHSNSSNVYGLLDNDDMFQYLGGLSMAVRLESGKTPETLVTNQQHAGEVTVEDMGKTLGREMRARYLNPKWIEGMKAEDYAGARAMADYVEYLWGWNMTTPEKVDAAKWQQTFEVYVEDKYGMELKEFFNRVSPWAFQSITARMLETHRKGYWEASEKQLETLSAEYAKSVVAKGIACCDHTCNNPMLNQMVLSVISIPGVLSPEIVEKFKVAVEQMAQKSIDEQVEERRQLLEKLAAPTENQPESETPTDTSKDSPTEADMAPTDAKMVEGYKMENMDQKEDTTEMSSSGMEWMAILAVLGIIGLVSWGVRKSGRTM